MRPERILLLRSGRHLQVAVDALRARFPRCHVGVVGTPGSRPAIEQAGIASSDVFTYDGARFQPLAFFFSRTAVAARRWRYSRVAILWNDPDGTGQGNVDRTACAMRLRGYLAITPDGGIVDRAVVPQVKTELLRVAASLAIAATLGVLLYMPAFALSAITTSCRRLTRRHEPQSHRGPERHVPVSVSLCGSSTEARSAQGS